MWKWLRNPKIASSVGFLILIALIWLVGPLLGLVSAEARFAWIFGVMLLWVASLLVGRLLAQRAGGLLEQILRRQADTAVLGASADQRAEVALLRQRLLAAIGTLKTSKLGKARGNAALYELPWYMVIGHPAAGKSSAILYSGLTFPFGDKQGVQGVGGTRNCDWFFSSEGVVLDTAGRYATQSEDRTEWLEFLKLLKRYRSKAPVNGILVAISLPELAQYQSDGFATYARQIRERIHEIEDAFGLRVPIYLLVTKLDLLGGFGQYFQDFAVEERSGVWGSTLSHEQGAEFDAAGVVGQRFEALYQGLVQLGEDKLANNRGNVKRPALFAFPIEFHGLKDAVCRFVECLHEHDPYHSKPLLRGFYFTSALQEGVPRINAGSRVSGQFDLARAGFEAAPAAASGSFFLRDLFREVIFPDQHLIGQHTKPALGRLRLALLAAGLGGLAAVASAMSWSYISNDALIDSVQAERAAARKMAAGTSIYERLQALHALQVRVDQLYQYRKHGHPWQLGFGLYRGDDLEQSLRREYFAALRALMLEPVTRNLEQTLAELKLEPVAPPAAPAPATPPTPVTATGATPAPLPQAAPVPATAAASVDNQRLDVAYNALKTYLMLNQPKRMEASHLGDQLPRYWRPWLATVAGAQQQQVHALAGQIVAFYVSQIGEPDLPLIANQAPQVAQARTVLNASLRRLSAKERVYSELKARANTRFAPLTVGAILNQQDSELLAGSHMVAGAFTRQAWDKYLRTAFDEASKGEIKSDDWVLASSMQDNLANSGDAERNRAELEALYKADYIREWRAFLQGVAVRDFANLPGAATALGKLADAQNSPLRRVLARVAYETAWDNPSELHRTLETARSSLLEKTQDLLSSSTPPAGSSATVQLGEVGGQFALLASISAGKDGAATPLQAYLEHLGKARAQLAQIAASDEPATGARQLMVATLSGSGSPLADGLQYVDGTLLASGSEDARAIVRPLLVRPLIQTYATLIPPVEQDINQAWEHEAYGQWKGLANKYPFTDSSNEAPVSEIARFAKPGGGTLAKFQEKYLGGLVQRHGDTFTPRTWANLGIRFNPAFLSGTARLNAVGNSVLREEGETAFELQPVPTPGLSEILIEIDGQTVLYRNGPQPWAHFKWPSANSSQGARIQVVFFNGATAQVVHFPGRLGLMRLLKSGRVSNPGGAVSQIVWPVRAGAGHAGSDVRVNFRMVSGSNPLMLSSLRHLALPGKITQ